MVHIFADRNVFAEQIWFDGDYSTTQQIMYMDLLAELQPKAVIFNACDVTTGECLTENSGKWSSQFVPVSKLIDCFVRWVGTESGEAPIENWST